MRALAERLSPAPGAVEPSPPITPGVHEGAKIRRTYYVRRDLAERLDDEARRLSVELGRDVAKSEVLEWLMERGFREIALLADEIRRGRTT